MLALLGFLGGLINPLANIASKIADARIAALKADTDEKKIAADERVKTLEQRRAVMVAESASRINPVMRALLAGPAVIFLWKVMVWDKVLGLGSTDNLSENLWIYLFSVVGFYTVEQLVARFKR